MEGSCGIGGRRLSKKRELLVLEAFEEWRVRAVMVISLVEEGIMGMRRRQPRNWLGKRRCRDGFEFDDGGGEPKVQMENSFRLFVESWNHPEPGKYFTWKSKNASWVVWLSKVTTYQIWVQPRLTWCVCPGE